MTPTTGRAVTLDEIAVDAATQIRADDGRMTAGNAQALDVARLNDPLNLDRVPAAIRESTRAVVWHYEERDGKLTKVPDVPSDPSRRASVTDPSTWDSFSVARDAVEDGKADGAGFVLGDGWVGVDLDKCRDPETGIIEPSALAIIEKLIPIPRSLRPARVCMSTSTGSSRPDGAARAWWRCTAKPGISRSPVPTWQPHQRRSSIEPPSSPPCMLRSSAHPTTGPGQRRRHFRRSRHSTINNSSGSPAAPATAPRSLGCGTATCPVTRRNRRPTSGSATTSRSIPRATPPTCDRLFSPERASCGRSGTHRGVNQPTAPTRSRGRSRGVAGATRQGPRVDVCAPPLRVEVAEHPLTEAGAAERFARLHGGDVRYDHGRGRWLLWQGHRWAPDCDAAMTRLALDFARTWQRESVDLTDRDLRERTFRAAVRLERRDALMSMLKLAADLRPIADVGNGWDASPWLLGTPNGVVDLRTGQLRPGQRDDRLTSPRVLSISQRHGPNSGSRPSARSSWTSTPSTSSRSPWGTRRLGTRDETAGSSRRARVATARGTVYHPVRRALGDYAAELPAAVFDARRESAPYDLAVLPGKRFIISSEAGDTIKIHHDRIK